MKLRSIFTTYLNIFERRKLFRQMEESIRRKNTQRFQQMKKLEEKLALDPSYNSNIGQTIVTMETKELISKLKDGELSALMVLKAFQSKALEVTKKANCITEFIPEAEEWAEACDRIPPEERGLLHGIPVSLKENIDVKGMDTTMGLAKYLYKPVSSHAVLVQVLLNNGAIPFCKTNVPQTLLSFCCTNPVYGITTNPHDSSRTPGGSSGGEAALIAAGGSILGIGTDSAGSGRVPAAFSGCFGLKTTQSRLSSVGLMKGKPGSQGICSAQAVMGRDATIIEACMKALTVDYQQYNLDTTVVPKLWNENDFHNKEKLTFGYYEDLEDIFPCTPGVKRAVKVAKQALENAGHTVVPFKLVNEPLDIFSEMMALVSADGGATLKRHMQNEIIDPSLKDALSISFSSRYSLYFLKFFVGLFSSYMSVILQAKYMLSDDLWIGLDKRDDFIKRFTRAMKENNIDLLLTPCYPIPAPQHYTPSSIPTACTYAAVFNYLDFPSGVLPVTKETDEDQTLLEEEYPEDARHQRIAKQATRGATGLPLGVEISGLRFQEELVCRGMNELEKALNNNSMIIKDDSKQILHKSTHLISSEPQHHEAAI